MEAINHTEKIRKEYPLAKEYGFFNNNQVYHPDYEDNLHYFLAALVLSVSGERHNPWYLPIVLIYEPEERLKFELHYTEDKENPIFLGTVNQIIEKTGFVIEFEPAKETVDGLNPT